MDIRAYRLRLGLNQAHLAKALGMPLRTLARWETTGRRPRLSYTAHFEMAVREVTRAHAETLREHAQQRVEQ